jgi:hypothetical protein
MDRLLAHLLHGLSAAVRLHGDFGLDKN